MQMSMCYILIFYTTYSRCQGGCHGSDM